MRHMTIPEIDRTGTLITLSKELTRLLFPTLLPLIIAISWTLNRHSSLKDRKDFQNGVQPHPVLEQTSVVCLSLYNTRVLMPPKPLWSYCEELCSSKRKLEVTKAYFTDRPRIFLFQYWKVRR